MIGAGTCKSTVQVTPYKVQGCSQGRSSRVWLYDIQDAGGTPQPGWIAAWCVGGTIKSEAYNESTHDGTHYPAGMPKVFVHRATYEGTAASTGVATVEPVAFEWPILGLKDVPVQVTLWAKSSATGMAKRPTLTICDPNYVYEHVSEPLTAAVVAADNTNWQTLTATYTPTADKPILVRFSAINATGTSFFLMQILGATIPAAGTVLSSQTAYGYPGATVAGTYVDPANANVRKGVAVGVDPRVGTLLGCVDTDGVNQGASGILVGGTFHATGVLAAAGYAATGVYDGSSKYTSGTWDGSTYHATGIIHAATYYATGWYNGTDAPATYTLYDLKTNYSDPGKANVAVGSDYTYAGVSQTAAYQTTADTNAAHLAADKIALNANLDEMIAANDSLQAAYGCDAGTAAGSVIVIDD
jgi:hypothetical protein